MMNILFTLCGRAGSKGLKSKNLLSILDKPLIDYGISLIELYIDTHPNDQVHIALNTDSDELKKQAISRNSEIVIIERTEELANDTVGKIEVIRDTFFKMKQKKEVIYDFIIDLDLTSPLRTLPDLNGLIEKYMNSQNTDLIFSVVPSRRNPFFNMVKLDGNQVSLAIKSQFTSRQQAPDVYDINGSMYLYKPLFLENNTYLFDGIIDLFVMKDYKVLDIDDKEDFEWMNFLMPKFLSDDPELKRVYLKR